MSFDWKPFPPKEIVDNKQLLVWDGENDSMNLGYDVVHYFGFWDNKNQWFNGDMMSHDDDYKYYCELP